MTFVSRLMCAACVNMVYSKPLGRWEARTAASEGAAGRFKHAVARHLAAAGELQASRHASCL